MLRHMTMRRLAVFLVIAATASCGGTAADAPAAASDATVSAGSPSPTATEADCSAGWVDYNADYPATASGSGTPQQAVEVWLSEQNASVVAASVEQQSDGLLYIDAERRAVARFKAAPASGGSWLMSSASLCPDNFNRP